MFSVPRHVSYCTAHSPTAAQFLWFVLVGSPVRANVGCLEARGIATSGKGTRFVRYSGGSR